MKDLIERQAAIDAVLGACKDTATTECAVRELEDLPSAQPEIIRCEDCMHNGSFDTDCPIGWNGKEYCSLQKGRKIVNKRTEEQMMAYVDGYNDCFLQFSECIKSRKSVMDAVRKMRLYKDAVNRVVTERLEE